ncbi:MAG: RsmE family RNA methyltransferase [bacterium]
MGSIPRIFLRETPKAGLEFPMDPSLSHYLTRVLRLGAGAPFRAFDPSGAEYEMVLTGTETPDAVARMISKIQDAPEKPLRIVLGQSLPKGSKMDLILRQGTEIGLDQIIPLLTERSISRPDKDQWEHKRDRWQKILIEACRQCGRRDVPELSPLTDWGAALESFSQYDQVLLPYEKEAPSFRDVLESNSTSRRILILIGPEGGWTPEEVAGAQSKGACVTHLPVPILRTETAGLAAAAMIRFFKTRLFARIGCAWFTRRWN